jgi:hypothetical protein
MTLAQTFCAALGICAALLAGEAQAAGLKRATVTAHATVLQPASVSVPLNLSTGAVKTKGSNPNGTVVVPATFPTFATPAPSYPDTTPQNGANSVAPNAARVDITGSPGAAFTLNFLTWSQLSGTAGATASAANNTYYSPTNSPTNQPRGIFNAQGKASIYIGANVLIARDPSGSAEVMKPTVSVTYN